MTNVGPITALCIAYTVSRALSMFISTMQPKIFLTIQNSFLRKQLGRVCVYHVVYSCVSICIRVCQYTILHQCVPMPNGEKASGWKTCPCSSKKRFGLNFLGCFQ